MKHSNNNNNEANVLPLKRCQMCLSGEPGREVRVAEPREVGSRNQPIDTGKTQAAQAESQGKGGVASVPGPPFSSWKPDWGGGHSSADFPPFSGL